jgi:hypothetical protein
MSSDPNKPDFTSLWYEPPSAANTNYPPLHPYNHVTQTDGGHLFELDDSPGRKRIRIQHGGPDEITAGAPAFNNGTQGTSSNNSINSSNPVGSFVEWTPNGDVVYKVVGDGYEIILQDKNMIVNGKLNVTIVGDAKIHHQGNKIEQVDGDYELNVKGNYSLVCQKLSQITSLGNMNINAGNGLLGSLRLSAGYVKIDGDLNCWAGLRADTVVANRVDAIMGMSAGPFGFVTELGGVSAGLPIAVPTCITAAGPVSSLTMVNSPLAMLGLSNSIFHFDIINNLLYNTHTHVTPVGLTAPPLPQMIAA